MNDPGGLVGSTTQTVREFVTQNYVFLWVALFVVVVLVIAWPHVRQALIDYRNQIVYPAPRIPEADNEEGLRLARLAQQERLKEASKEAKEQEKLKPKKKPQKLRPNTDDYPLSPWSSSSGGGGGGRNLRFFKAPACNTGG